MSSFLAFLAHRPWLGRELSAARAPPHSISAVWAAAMSALAAGNDSTTVRGSDGGGGPTQRAYGRTPFRSLHAGRGICHYHQRSPLRPRRSCPAPRRPTKSRGEQLDGPAWAGVLPD